MDLVLTNMYSQIYGGDEVTEEGDTVWLEDSFPGASDHVGVFMMNWEPHFHNLEGAKSFQKA